MRAIDAHIHFSTEQGYIVKDRNIVEAMEKYYRIKVVYKTEEEMARDFTDLDVKAILMPIDAETKRGWKTSNDYAAGLVRRFPQAYIGSFAAIDPWKGIIAMRELERAVKELGMMGIKFQQAIQGFYPNDRNLLYPFYEKAVELGVPVLFHCGTTGAGAGLPGGGGFRLDYTRPIPYIDDVACDFPGLTIIMAHPGWPWIEEQLAVLLHKANVYMDLSGWAPKYFPEFLKREINGRLQDKMLYGSDYPEIPPRRWLDEFEAGGYKPEVVEKVLLKNAIRVFSLKID